MTTTPRPRRRSRTADPEPPGPPLRVRGPAALLAALPAMLGFTPERSLVLACLQGPGGRRLAVAARVDLPADEADGPALGAQLGAVCEQTGATAVVLVVVDDGPATHAGLVGATAAAARARGVEVAQVLRVPRIEAGWWWEAVPEDGRPAVPWGPLRGVEGLDHGVQDDPWASPVAAAHVLAGRVLHHDRSGLAAVVAPDPGAAEPERRRDVAAAVAAARAARRDGLGDPRAGLAAVLAAVARCEDGVLPEGPELARLAAALDDRRVRDAAVALAVSEHAGAAEVLWAHVARALPAPWRAEAACLLALVCYARGEGPSAGVALDAALAADPAHTLAGMLRSGLDSALPPAEVRLLAAGALPAAAALGVEL